MMMASDVQRKALRRLVKADESTKRRFTFGQYANRDKGFVMLPDDSTLHVYEEDLRALHVERLIRISDKHTFQGIFEFSLTETGIETAKERVKRS